MEAWACEWGWAVKRRACGCGRVRACAKLRARAYQARSSTSCSKISRTMRRGRGDAVIQIESVQSCPPRAQQLYALPLLGGAVPPSDPGAAARRNVRGLNDAHTTGSVWPTKSHASDHSLPSRGRLSTTAMLTGFLKACGQHKCCPSGDQQSRRKSVLDDWRCGWARGEARASRVY